ncbi:MAG: serine hydrolase domain-containing protein, partial [Pseudomonadota bacterium]
MQSIIIRFFAGIVSAGVLAVCPSASASESTSTADVGIGEYGEEAESIHQRRFQDLLAAFAAGEGTTRYDTLAELKGADAFIPLARAGAKTIPSEALNRAIEYAGARRSAALMVYRHGVVEEAHYYGETTPQTLIKSKSLAKPLGVVAIGRAIKIGAIDSLDQPVSDFIREWRNTDKQNILVRHLLDMRSGLLRQGFSPEMNHILNRAYLHPYHDDVIINHYPLTDPPGERYEYSNATSELVGPLIERATGVEYETFLEEQVLAPLGAQGGSIWMNREGGAAHSGCCVQLPADSWLRLAVLVLNDGVWDGEALLPDGFATEMKTPTALNPHAGMGLFLGSPYKEWRGVGNPENDFSQSFHSEPYVDEDLLLFDGNGNQVAYIVPSEDLVIMRLGETP